MIDYHNSDNYEVVVIEHDDIDWHEACLKPNQWLKKKTVSHSYHLVRKDVLKSKTVHKGA